jgi:tetratricopeptide (TPR) repeat protein
LGNIYWEGNHLEDAEAEFTQELKISPQDFTVMYDLAAVSVERSKPQAAVDLLRPVLAVHPESRKAHYQMGRAQAQLGHNDSAIDEFSAVVKSAGPLDPEIERQSYYQLAQLYRREQKMEESRVALNEFLRLKQEADAQQNRKLEDKLKRSEQP